MQDEEKTVDIDTSGPDTEVEINQEETSDTTATESTETGSTESVEPVAEDKTFENERETKLDQANQEEKKVEENKKEKELEQYSESVQKRIAKLTKKWREAERQREEALTYAQTVIQDKQKAEEKLSKLEPGFMKSTEDSIVAGIEAAKAELTKAREAGDINAEVAAQTKISELGYKQAKFLETKAQQEEIAKNKPKEPEINLNRQPAAQGTPDPKAEDWASKNTWFGQDTAMTYTAFDLHKKLTEQEGFDPSSDEYYSEIDKRIRLEFPHKFANNEQKAETTRPVQTVASAKRSTNTGRKTVRLTSSQVAIAKKLGVPLE